MLDIDQNVLIQFFFSFLIPILTLEFCAMAHRQITSTYTKSIQFIFKAFGIKKSHFLREVLQDMQSDI